jgi:hypothetical protein
LHVIAWIDVSARDHAVNFRDDVTVAKVELGLIEVAVSGIELGLRPLDGRRARRQSSKRAVATSPLSTLSNCSTICFGSCTYEWTTPSCAAI